MTNKHLILILIALLLTVSLMGNNAINIRGGVLFPSGSKSSFMPGISYGINVDDIVELAVGFDYFFNNYTEKRKVSFDQTEAGNEVDEIEAGTDIKTGYIPLMATLKVAFPVDLPVLPYGGVGLGWAIMWENIFVPASRDDEPEKHNAVDELYIYNGFNWIMNLGAKYQLSPSVYLYGETFYNLGKMKKDVKKTEEGRIWSEIDMSGLGLRLGIEMGFR